MEYLNQPSFSAGEIGPELYARVDQDFYNIGLKTAENVIIRQYGGASNRAGTKFVGQSKISSRKSRLIPFQFNNEQTYAIDLGHLYMRIIKDGAEVLEAAVNISGATQANPCVITANAHGYSNGDDVYITGIVGMTELNGRTFRVAGVTTNTFQLTTLLGTNVNSSAFAAYGSGGTVARVYTVATPWEEGDLFDLTHVQNNDVITITHPDYAPRDITRTAHNAWTIATFAAKEGPFQDQNTDTAITVYSNAQTGSVTLTASSSIFTAGMVGELFYLAQKIGDDVPRWETNKLITTTVVRRAGSHYYENTTTGTTGTYRPDWTEGEEYDGDLLGATAAVKWKYLHSGYGIIEITGFTSGTQVTGAVISLLPALAVGSSNASYRWAKAAWGAGQGYPSCAAYHKQRMWFGGDQGAARWIVGFWRSRANLPRPRQPDTSRRRLIARARFLRLEGELTPPPCSTQAAHRTILVLRTID